MKRKLFTILFTVPAAVCVVCGLAACAETTSNHEGTVKVVFNLEGGVYRNCKDTITYYYGFKAGTQNRIYEPQELSGEEVTRANYTLDGWYRNKTVDGDRVSYSEKWDFGKSSVSDAGLTLYARWRPNVNYSYNVCYYDDNHELQVIGTYDGLYMGDVFADYKGFGRLGRPGYTFLGFEDEEGNPWNSAFTHPGGETDTAVNVIATYIEGEYNLVSTAAQLKSSRRANIYLTDDIDFGGEKFEGFGDYEGSFIGNGHKITNFTLGDNFNTIFKNLQTVPALDEESGLLCLSLFGNMKNASVQDVTFENVTIDVDTIFSQTKKIFIAPIATSMENSSVKGVTVSGTFTCTKLPDAFEKENLLVEATQCYYVKDDDSTVENVTVTVDDECGEYFSQTKSN